jgi:3D (Asp-Asp-Asp) domain-containing protein
VEVENSRAREESKSVENKAVEPQIIRNDKSEKYVITAYCPCVKCCGKTDGITASGVKAVEGVTVAMNKSVPFGTKIYIDGVGERIVQDRGGAIKGNRIDLYFNDHQSALEFGRQTKEVTILN